MTDRGATTGTMVNHQTDVPSGVEENREDAAEYQTETPTDWTSPDERKRGTRTRRFDMFTKLLDHDPDTGLLTDDGVEEYDKLARAIKGSNQSLLDDIKRANRREQVTVTAPVENRGNTSATKTVELTVDGTTVATQQATLTPGESREVMFTTQVANARARTLETLVDDSETGSVEIDGATRQWINPRSANAGSIKGAHPATVGDDLGEYEMDAPNPVDSSEAAAELIETYLFAVCRNVEFADYGTGQRTDDAAAFDTIEGFDSITQWAADRLSQVLKEIAITDAEFTDEQAVAAELELPTEGDYVTPATLFRGYSGQDGPNPSGDLVGPYHSQFFLQQLYPLFPSGCAPYVAGLTGVTELELDDIAIPRHVPIANRREFGVSFDDFVAVQNGFLPKTYRESDFAEDQSRYPITGRDMGTHVHTDGPYQEYYNTATTLVFWNFPRTPLSPYGSSVNEADAVTFGPVDPFSLVGAVSYEAFKASWVQKWRSFRRLRPEAMAGLVELDRNRSKSTLNQPLDDLFDTDVATDVLEVVAEYNDRQREEGFTGPDDGPTDTYLLGQMYPEGSPTHPAYPSGHATMAGAGVTVLKALFDDRASITATGMRPVRIDPEDPTEHVFIDRGRYADPAIEQMTVGSELDKLASNVAHARMFGGVHFRSDGERGIRLGEQVAIRFLQDHLRSYPESEFGGAFELTDRNGRRLQIEPENVTEIT